MILGPPSLSKDVSDALDDAVGLSDWIEKHRAAPPITEPAAKTAGTAATPRSSPRPMRRAADWNRQGLLAPANLALWVW